MTDTTSSGPFYKRVDWAAFWTATIGAFLVYLATIGPTVGLEDSGELAVAADWLGVPHPPGYPIWTMLCWLFTKVFSFVTYMGQPNPAWSISLASAVFGAFAAGCSAMLICRSGSDILQTAHQITHNLSKRTEEMICFVGGVSASLLFAFTPIMWSQAVIVEVYSLNALFLTWVLLLVYQWMRRPSDPTLFLVSFLFGLGLTNYQVILLAALALAICIMFRNFELFRDFLVAAIPFGIVILLMSLPLRESLNSEGQKVMVPLLPEIIHPSHITCFVYMGLNGLWLTLIYFTLPHGRVVAPCILLAELGLAAYGYMPIVSDLRNPPMNWGYPRTWAGFKHAVSRGQYEKIIAADIFSKRFLHQFGVYLTDLRINYALIGALLGFIPFATWRLKSNNRTYSAMPMAVTLAGIALVGAAVASRIPLASASLLYKLPTLAVLLILGVGGGVVLVDAFKPVYDTYLRDHDAKLWQRLSAGAVYAMVGLFWSILVAYHVKVATDPLAPAGKAVAPAIASFIRHGYAIILISMVLYMLHLVFEGFIDRILGWSEKARKQRILVTLAAFVFLAVIWTLILVIKSRDLPGLSAERIAGIRGSLIGLPFFLILPVPFIALYAKLADMKEQFQITIHPHSRQWFAATAIAFIMLSIFLIALANLKMDIQDTFIQRVKFISSHALFALWVGYGMIFTLATIDAMAKDNTAIRYASLALALGLVAVPLTKNWHDDNLINIYGGSEQNGHDFGWQFGNYQLRGAAAIMEELDPNEPPLPNPSYPPEMTPNAIFFGGTDPGRFVPTYMIYSARVREDVYLITQNALADNTYMAVMRDLYGNDIWIPSEEDSGKAFRRYVDDINAGRRPRNAGITTEGGRVQVSGVLGVMQINGILAEEIFNANKWRHDFYIEESYVIEWMYPYLTPHGLILKINKQKLAQLPAEIVKDDMEFWAWYTRRLTSSTAFQRDVVARKSFSKLRSAIAGLYAWRGMRNEAITAFNEARELYPLSPEANFRLSELYMRASEFEEARKIITDFGEMDPLNARVQPFVNQIDHLQGIHLKIETLRKQFPDGKMDANSALKLADLYLQVGQIGQFNGIAHGLMSNTTLPPQFHFQLARLYQKANNKPQLSKALDLCLKGMPDNTDPSIFLQIARLYSQAQNATGMHNAMSRYLARSPTDWKAWIDVALLSQQIGKQGEAIQALANAIQYGGANAEQEIQRHPLLRQLRRHVKTAPRNPTGNFDRFFNRQQPAN